jgi:hypothetical protein
LTLDVATDGVKAGGVEHLEQQAEVAQWCFCDTHMQELNILFPITEVDRKWGGIHRYDGVAYTLFCVGFDRGSLLDDWEP